MPPPMLPMPLLPCLLLADPSHLLPLSRFTPRYSSLLSGPPSRSFTLQFLKSSRVLVFDVLAAAVAEEGGVCGAARD